ncbi:hypothetical protein [Spirochaeta africana]|uniref:Uncharacterized protein n=1 Tax=Spirochaeta africana (strain ATCC 700263 / DSM 8902 / Z-7692) TaxID=889378 RepID=H9UIJ7_SPIAZ|nr:hypothetical protein [Spirochaeta africana]AFG37340.1 hypothetical protein Spiaf_1265 [Spirochaeta africana DSM 8902]
MSKRLPRRAGLILAAGVTLLLAGCSTRIARIQSDPSGYAGRTVTVQGTVDRIFPLPVGEYRVGILSDDTAAIPVLVSGDYRAGDAVRLRAEVVAFSADGIRASRDEFEQRIGSALTAVGADGDDLARRVMNLLIPLAETFEITYLLIEQ